MIVHRLRAAPSAELARALAAFEAQFRYPLGPGRTFRISHGEDYPRFFRAMENGVCFIAMHEGNVVGTLGAAMRWLALADASERFVAYLGDLKVAPIARRGRAVIALLRAAREWASAHVDAAFSVVMDGTAATPKNYSGRLGIPPLEQIGKVVVFQLPTARAPDGAHAPITARASGIDCHQRLRAGRCTLSDGDPEERSECPPQWLMLPDRSACGRLEDTLKAKRLFADDGAELRSAHLSCLAYDSVRSGAALIRAALRRGEKLGFGALFVAIAEPEAASFAAAFAEPPLTVAPATIFGAGLAPHPLWNINTAEI